MTEIEKLRSWFLENKRAFPWRENPTPYGVWVSEVMLQQTRASVVVDYFERWMKKFPTVLELAKAPLEEVIKAWEGLGYYSRARNLHEGAKKLAGKTFPCTKEDLLQIKGVGSYTAGAILSFAFHEKEAAVDGNVARVIARYFAIQEDLSSSLQKKNLEKKTFELLPNEEPWVVMEALIELGATLCGRTPSCSLCPLSSSCLSYLQGKTGQIPVKKKRIKTIYLYTQVFLILFEDKILLENKKEEGLFEGLVRFPSAGYDMGDQVASIEKILGMELIWQEDLKKERQFFTVHEEELSPSLYRALEKKEVPGFSWHKLQDISLLSFSSGHKRILKQVIPFLLSSPACCEVPSC